MSIDEFSEGDILYRINSQCLVGGISDEDFRNNAQGLLEDIRGYFMGRYEVMAEFRPPQMDGCIACHDNLNARIAELTAEVELMRSSLRLCLSSASSWEERASLHRKRSDDYSAGIYQSLEGCAEEIQDITRNALKDGV